MDLRFSGHRGDGGWGKKGTQVKGQAPELPGGHHDGLALAPQSQAVGARLSFTFLHLWVMWS